MAFTNDLKQYILLIDCSGDLVLLLLSPQKIFRTIIKVDKLDLILLATLDNFLKKNKVQIKDLLAIGIVNDSKSFVTTRLSLSAINTIAWANKIKTFGVTQELFNLITFDQAKKLIPNKISFVTPHYASQPLISKSKHQYHFLKD